MAFSRATGHPIGVGIVGLSASGQWAANAHVPALRAIEGYELRALSASSAESAAAAGRVHDVPLTFAHAEELAVTPSTVVDAGDGWLAADRGVGAVVVVGVEPDR